MSGGAVPDTTDPEAPDASAPRFSPERPADLRKVPPWHGHAYIMRALPRGLAELAPELGVGEGGRVLDYGAADAPYRRWFPRCEWVAADLPGNPSATLELSPDGTVPAEDESFDGVLSTQVLEHVTDPGLHLAECVRVLRPGGRLLLSTHGIMLYHPDPDDYWRWTGAGLRRAVGNAGLRVVRFEGIMGQVPAGLQLVQDGCAHRLPRPLRPAFIMCMQIVIAQADRLHGREGRRRNALVYALVAEKP